MNKDKEWFIKELLGHEIGDYGNYYNGGYEDGLAYALKLAHQLNEPEKIVIPQFVADWINQAKKWEYSIGDSMGHVGSYFDTDQYDKAVYWAKKNQDTFARAWLDGYEIEKEKLYLVSSEENSSGFWFLSKDNDGEIVIGTNEDYFKAGWKESKLTEKEIKDYDPRYWAFAAPVEEEEK